MRGGQFLDDLEILGIEHLNGPSTTSIEQEVSLWEVTDTLDDHGALYALYEMEVDDTTIFIE